MPSPANHKFQLFWFQRQVKDAIFEFQYVTLLLTFIYLLCLLVLEDSRVPELVQKES